VVQPAVNIGWRQLIFCHVATKLMQPRNHLMQPTVNIGWHQPEGQGHHKSENHPQPVRVSFLVVSAKNVLSRCLVGSVSNFSQHWLAPAYFCSVATKLMQSSNHMGQPPNYLAQPTVKIGWRQHIFHHVAVKLVHPQNHLVQPSNHLV
jgi:hypothetical protein